MKMQKDDQGFMKELDPAVADLLGRGDRRTAERSMPVASRKKVKREQAKAEARKGKRALYDLPETIIEGIEKVAKEFGTSNSQIAKLALWMFLASVREGEVDVTLFRVPASKNPRFDFVIELPNDE